VRRRNATSAANSGQRIHEKAGILPAFSVFTHDQASNNDQRHVDVAAVAFEYGHTVGRFHELLRGFLIQARQRDLQFGLNAEPRGIWPMPTAPSIFASGEIAFFVALPQSGLRPETGGVSSRKQLLWIHAIATAISFGTASLTFNWPSELSARPSRPPVADA
jgi:hypothetical protein